MMESLECLNWDYLSPMSEPDYRRGVVVEPGFGSL